MKRILCALLLATTYTCSLSAPPKKLSDAEHKPITKERFLSLSKEGERNISCRIRFIDPYFGYLDDSSYYKKKFPLRFSCQSDSDTMVDLNATRPEYLQRVYQLTSINATGWAFSYDFFEGEAAGGERILMFCLIYPPNALCGDGDVGYLKDGRKGDLTDYALKILRSIEFLPDESSTSETIQPTQ